MEKSSIKQNQAQGLNKDYQTNSWAQGLRKDAQGMTQCAQGKLSRTYPRSPSPASLVRRKVVQGIPLIAQGKIL